MLRWLIRRRLAAFEARFGYDASYMRELLAADLGGFFAFYRASRMTYHRRDVPLDVFYTAKLVGTLVEDCGPCTQLNVTMALHDKVAPETLRAVLAGDVTAMPPPVALAYRFAKTAAAHDVAADELRDQVVATWGKRGLTSLALGLTAARMYPTMKYALGYGKACTRVTVAGTPIAVARDAS